MKKLTDNMMKIIFRTIGKINKLIASLIATMGLFYQMFIPDRKWSNDSCLKGKTVIVTGGSSGIGVEVVRDLAAREARVVVGCRNVAKGEHALREFVLAGGDIIVKQLELASFASVRQFAKEVLKEEQHIHILINNAGLAGCPHLKTEDGFEMQFGVNHLGHFLLTLLLVERMKESVPARIVNVSSMIHFLGSIHFDDINLDNNYNHAKGYAQSKLANVLFTRELCKRLKGTGITTYSLHPGVINTNLQQNLDQSMGSIWKRIYSFFSSIFFKNVRDGARTSLYCATEPSLDNESGLYYSGCRKMPPSFRARDDEAAKTLWEMSEIFTGIRLN